MKKSRIYTMTGDDGTTSLAKGTRVTKTHARLEAYGTVDELNALLGMLAATVNDDETRKQLHYVQHKLFSVGAYLATEHQNELQGASRLPDESIKFLEQAIDGIDAALPPLRGFILPGGSQASALCHICRTVCRRAERRILALEEKEVCKLDNNIKRFVNRLSDYLFVLARKLNKLTDEDEIYWDKDCM